MKDFLRKHLSTGNWTLLLGIICVAILAINVPSTPKGALTVGIPIILVVVGGSKLYAPLERWINK
tara:strand:- start:80 stop:274 length:195 start_codon:yes stop_codon:yes gene_type:complete